MFDGITTPKFPNFAVLTMFAGDTKVLVVAATDDADVAVELAGASITWQMARTSAGPAFLTKTLGAGIALGAPGTLEVTLDGADTEGYAGRFYQETEIVAASGDITTVGAGYATIKPALIRHDGPLFPDPPPPADSFETLARKAADIATLLSAQGYTDTAIAHLAAMTSPHFTGTSLFDGDVTMLGTGALGLPIGTTAQRPNTGNVGSIRWNSTTGRMEHGTGGIWRNHVRLDGDTLTGPLILAADPATALGAATKQYADKMLPLAGGSLNGTATITATGGGGFTATSGTGTISINNGLVTTPLLNVGASGTTTAAGVLAPQFKFSRNLAGTLTGSPVFIDLTTSLDNADGGAAAQVPTMMRIKSNYGSATSKGHRTLIQESLQITGRAADTSQQINYMTSDIRLEGWTPIGNSTPARPIGAGWAMNPQAFLRAGATNWLTLQGLELDVGIEAGASAGRLLPFQIVVASLHQTKGFVGPDVGFLVTAQTGAVGLDYALALGNTGGQLPVAPTGKLFTVLPQTTNGGFNLNAQLDSRIISGGFDTSLVNYTIQNGEAWSSPGMGIRATGGLRIANAELIPTANGILLDAPNQIVTGATVAAAGNPTTTPGVSLGNYYAGDIIAGPSPGSQYLVATVLVLNAAVTAGGTGGTNGAQTVTATTGTGTKAQFSVTIAAGAIASVDAVLVAGSYTVNPTNLNAEPVTGAGLTGATLAIGMGVATVSVLVPDVAAGGAATYPNPVATLYGSGVSRVNLNLVWAPANGVTIARAGSKLGIWGATPVVKPTGVPITTAGIHAALTSIGLIAP